MNPHLNVRKLELVLAALGLAATGCAPVEAHSDVLHIVAKRRHASEEEVQSMLDVGEALLPEIAALHPEGIVMDDEIRVELHGRYGESPYVDDDGTVHMWRFSKAEGGYHALYAHELVHAIAYDDLVGPAVEDIENAGFYLEGWAEYVALLVDPGKTGFSLFGYDEDVVVGHWLLEGGPSIADYRENHEELSLWPSQARRLDVSRSEAALPRRNVEADRGPDSAPLQSQRRPRCLPIDPVFEVDVGELRIQGRTQCLRASACAVVPGVRRDEHGRTGWALGSTVENVLDDEAVLRLLASARGRDPANDPGHGAVAETRDLVQVYRLVDQLLGERPQLAGGLPKEVRRYHGHLRASPQGCLGVAQDLSVLAVLVEVRIDSLDFAGEMICEFLRNWGRQDDGHFCRFHPNRLQYGKAGFEFSAQIGDLQRADREPD